MKCAHCHRHMYEEDQFSSSHMLVPGFELQACLPAKAILLVLKYLVFFILSSLQPPAFLPSSFSVPGCKRSCSRLPIRLVPLFWQIKICKSGFEKSQQEWRIARQCCSERRNQLKASNGKNSINCPFLF